MYKVEGCWDPCSPVCEQPMTVFLWTGVQERLCLGYTCCWCQVVIFGGLSLSLCLSLSLPSVSYSQAQAPGEIEGVVVDSSNCWQPGECGKLYSCVLMKMRTQWEEPSSCHLHLVVQFILALLLHMWYVWWLFIIERWHWLISACPCFPLFLIRSQVHHIHTISRQPQCECVYTRMHKFRIKSSSEWVCCRKVALPLSSTFILTFVTLSVRLGPPGPDQTWFCLSEVNVSCFFL